MSFIRVLVLGVAIAACTFFFGWLSLPVIGAVYALIRRDVSAPGEVALGALLGWGALFARVAIVPAFARLLAKLGGVFPVPGVVLAIISLVFAAVLAWSAARVVSALVARPRAT